MKRYALIMLLLSVISVAFSANSSKVQSKLFLVGGGLESCSSMSIKNCNTKGLDNPSSLQQGKTTSFYQINSNIITLVDTFWPKYFERRNFVQIIRLLKKISHGEKDELLSKSQLRTVFKRYDTKRIINKLNDAEYYLLLDLLEQPVLAEDGTTRLKEKVLLEHSKNVFSTEIYQEFIALAQEISQKKTPKILVITASARDPFEAVDFYQAAFTQAGGDTSWLPLDATLNALIQQPGERQKICQQLAATRLIEQGSINREYVYPDLTEQQFQACLAPKEILESIKQADGIFINGGDQSLTAKAFVNKNGSDSEALKLIKNKLASNSLIIGGTSAGTAVMSGGKYNQSPTPMITNGQSNTAIFRGAKKNVLPQEGCQKSNSCGNAVLNDDLTYNASGGLGLFHWGIMDTHFSERGRQGRLAKLVLDTNTRFAFGVDETTALVVGNMNTTKPTFEVIGQSGVFVVESSLGSKKGTKVLSHYLTRGDKAQLMDKALTFNLASWKKQLNEDTLLPMNIDEVFRGEKYKQTAKLLCLTNNTNVLATSKWRKNIATIKIKKLSDAVSRYGIIFSNSVEKGYCSYIGYQLEIQPH